LNRPSTPGLYIIGVLLTLTAATLTGCAGDQSTLAPSGRDAERIAELFWWMAGTSLVIWLGVVSLGIFAVYAEPSPRRPEQARRLIVAGAVIPAVALFFLLIYGLSTLPAMVARAPEGTLRISVTGEQWWWRVRYEPPNQPPFELANEIRMPAGRPVEFILRSTNVIHSFWIPSIGGKVDMIPGRENRLVLYPNRIGRFRGICAEYCGVGHAKMAFEAVVLAEPDFAKWLDNQSKPAVNTAGESARAGE
jgi:cytochrome c oxidase subunit II